MEDKVLGKIQEIKGKLTGDKAEELKGKARQKVGGAKETADDLRRRVEPGQVDRRDQADWTDEEPPQDRDVLRPQ